MRKEDDPHTTNKRAIDLRRGRVRPGLFDQKRLAKLHYLEFDLFS